MSDAYVGEIRVFAGNFAPVGWLQCQGQLLSIADYTVLYTIVGTTYGGDGVNTFALPQFSGRLPIGSGQAPGIGSSFVVGQSVGVESSTVLSNNMPLHTHALGATSKPGVTHVPGPNTYLAAVTDAAGSPINIYGLLDDTSTPLNSVMSLQSISIAGGGAPIPVRNPFLALSLIICTQGFYPSRP